MSPQLTDALQAILNGLTALRDRADAEEKRADAFREETKQRLDSLEQHFGNEFGLIVEKLKIMSSAPLGATASVEKDPVEQYAPTHQDIDPMTGLPVTH